MTSAEKFYDLLSEYMNLAATKGRAAPQEQADSIYQQFMEMIEFSEVDTATVIRSISAMLKQYVSLRLALLELMRNIKYMSEYHGGGYSYPEFFWLTVESGIMTDVNDINSIMTALTDIANSDIIRAYLNYALLTRDQANTRNIVTAYY